MNGDVWAGTGVHCVRTGAWAVGFQGLEVGAGGSTRRVGLGVVSRLRLQGRATFLWT